MAKSLRSASWYRVADLRPRLRVHARIHRQRFRGQTWYVLQDRQTGRYHRLSPPAHHIVCMMDGRRTVDEIWEVVRTRYPDDQPTQDDTIRLLAQLHAADLLIGELPPDMDEVSFRAERHARQTLLQHLRNPLALRFPLIDPDRVLTETVPVVRPLFTTGGFLVWLAVVIAGVVLAAMNWAALTHNIADQVLSAGNIALLLLIYPAIKALHELGHAYATKRWGGEMHEMGVMLLVLVPIPYVDASSSSAFASKRQRMVVGAAGIMVETFLAAVAMMFWTALEPGLARAVAFNVILIGGVSTVLFNGNPLLRFDGYYVLADMLEIPNLGTRANQYALYLVQRYAFQLHDVQSPATAPGEEAWLLGFAVASFLYRMSVMLGIALFIGTKLFFIGVALALWTVTGSLVFPLVKAVRYVVQSPQLRRRRRRAVTVSAAAALAVLVLLLVVPVPYGTVAQGVVMVPERAAVRALSDGDIEQVLAPNEGHVSAGTPLLRLSDPELASKADVLRVQDAAYKLRLDAVLTSDLVQANIFREQIRHIEGELALDQKQLSDLTIRSPNSGRFILPHAVDLPGRFVHKGDLLGYVVGRGDPVVRAVVPQSDVDLVRQRTLRVDVRFADRFEQVSHAAIVRQVPAASSDLPSLALSTKGGGDIALDPSDPEHPRALETLFQFDVQIPAQLAADLIGERVYLRFDHGNEPIAWRLLRSARQIFLKQFGA